MKLALHSSSTILEDFCHVNKCTFYFLLFISWRQNPFKSQIHPIYWFQQTILCQHKILSHIATKIIPISGSGINLPSHAFRAAVVSDVYLSDIPLIFTVSLLPSNLELKMLAVGFESELSASSHHPDWEHIWRSNCCMRICRMRRNYKLEKKKTIGVLTFKMQMEKNSQKRKRN